MKRKTNLFYKSASQDSNFLTFSNYTESLTANLMSTDNKIFPSTFLCINIPKLYDKSYAEKTYKEWENSMINSESNNAKYILRNVIVDDNGVYVDETGFRYNKDVELTENQVNEITGKWIYDNTKPIYHNKVIIDLYKADGKTKIGTPQEFFDKNSTVIKAITIDKIYIEFKDNISFDSQKDIFIWNKQQLINLLTYYYENKLATLRDWCVSNNKIQEQKLLPLNYLLETISEFDSNYKISCIGDVTEQDWNGTFADTICVVSTSKYKSGTLEIKKSDSIDCLCELSNESEKYLHGWYTTKYNYNPDLDFDKDGKNTVSLNLNDTNHLYTRFLKDKTDKFINEFKRTHRISTTNTDDYNYYITKYIPGADQKINEYEKTLQDIIDASKIEEIYIGPRYVRDLNPKYDSTDNGIIYYNMSSDISRINYELKEAKQIEFNVLIPLFDIVDMNYKTNSTKVETSDYLDLTLDNSVACIKNVPLGMWFSGTSPVVLNPDLSTGFCPSWSLSLSSQFKPFPNSTYMPDEISQDSKKEAFCTFAQILNKQNKLFDKFISLSKNLNKLSDRVATLESAIGSVLTTYNIDNFTKDMIDFKNQISYQVNYLETQIVNLQPHWEQRD